MSKYLFSLFIVLTLLACDSTANKGLVEITSEPGGAKVFVDGQRKGTTPTQPGKALVLELEEGEYKLEGKMEDGSEAKLDVFVPAGGIQPAHLIFTPKTPAVGKVFQDKVFQDKLKDGSLAPKMVVVPSGSFEMGSNDGQDDEKPVHTVSVNQFAIGVYEVTFEEYDKFCDSTGRSKPSDEGLGRGTRPVIHVSWNDAVAYTKWLSERTGNEYRLPTEAEWEYSARAGSTTNYWWGDDIGTNKANCNSECGDSYEYTSPVGSFKANPFGLYDTVGNVWEWTCSDYTSEGYGSGAEQVCSGNTNESKAVRGGSWFYDSVNSRSALRVSNSQDDTNYGYGFRILRTY